VGQAWREKRPPAAEACACAGSRKPVPASTRRWRRLAWPNSPAPIPRELSGGMKMRVSLAARAGHRSRYSVDGRAVRRTGRDHALFASTTICSRLWRNLHKTVIFVTHSVFESVPTCHKRVIVMTSRPGRIGSEFHIKAAEPRGEAFSNLVRLRRPSAAKYRIALAPSYAGQGV